VESVLRESEESRMTRRPSIDDVLKEISEKSGTSREHILGPSRNRKVKKSGSCISILHKKERAQHWLSWEG